MIVYDNSLREEAELRNRFHSNMKEFQESVVENIILERHKYWHTMYFIWLKPESYWQAILNSIITGEPIYTKIGEIEICDNASVNIDIYKNSEYLDRLAKYLDIDNFRVTVVDRTERII